MKENLCSVIIPIYNCAETIGQTIQSALNQSHSNLEILLIDDRSTDNSLEIIKGFAENDTRIRIIENKKNIGVAQSRNKGFESAKGKYVALLDGDDIWEPDKLERQIAILQNSNCDFCYTSYSYINYKGENIGLPHIIPNSCTYEGLLKENFICCSSVLLRSELTQKHKMTNEFFHEDFVYWLDLLKSGYKAIGCKDILVKYRVSQKGRSNDKLAAAKNRWYVYRKFCKMGTAKSLYYFFCYAFHGLKKYRKMARELH